MSIQLVRVIALKGLLLELVQLNLSLQSLNGLLVLLIHLVQSFLKLALLGFQIFDFFVLFNTPLLDLIINLLQLLREILLIALQFSVLILQILDTPLQVVEMYLHFVLELYIIFA